MWSRNGRVANVVDDTDGPRNHGMTSAEGADEAALERSYDTWLPMAVDTGEVLLKEAKQIMDDFGVVFFLRQGTCLGAIRDNALIPWDDDLDLGSVIGLHGLDGKSVDQVVDRVVAAFRDNGYFAKVESNDQFLSVTMMKSSTRLDWLCHRVIDDSVYQYPGVRFPVSLFTELREIDFIGEKFLTPNPPEEYLRLKYGEEWMIPKREDYEKDVVGLIPVGPIAGQPGLWKQFFARHFLPSRSGKIRILDHEGEPVAGADVVVVGLNRSRTDRRGYASFYLPRDDFYALIIRYRDHEEVLYQESMAPGAVYVYRPDPAETAGRFRALSQE